MAGGEDNAIYYSYCQIAELCVALAKECYERHGYDIQHTDGNHCAHRAACIELSSLVNVLCHSSAECAVRQVDASVAKHQDAVGHSHIHNLCSLAPVGVCPESEHEYDGCYGCSEQKPRAEASPACVGLVGKGSDDRIVHGIPYSRYKHKCGYGAHSDAKHVGVENHEEVAYEHPTEVAAYIAHSIGNLADERHTAFV